MNKNKGFIGIGLIIAIVLGIVVVGGGAYYLGKGSNKLEVKSPENVLPNVENQNSTNVSVNLNNKVITVLSPNGGEVYKDIDKIAIKWKGTGKDRIAIYLRFYSGEWCLIKDVPSTNTNYTFTPSGHDCGDGRGSISGIQKYKITLIAYENGGMAPEPGAAFAGDYSDNDGSDTGYSIDSSDNYFTINSAIKNVSTKLFESNLIKQEGLPLTCLANGITVTLPKNGFDCYSNKYLTNAVSLALLYKGRSVMNINKYNNNISFSNFTPNSSDYESVDMNYNINGISAPYYKNYNKVVVGDQSDWNVINFFSKLTTIEVPDSVTTITSLTQSEIDQIIASIKIN